MAETTSITKSGILSPDVENAVRVVLLIGTFPEGAAYERIVRAFPSSAECLPDILHRLEQGRLVVRMGSEPFVYRLAKPLSDFTLFELLACLGEELRIVNVSDTEAYGSRSGEAWQKLFVAHTVVRKILGDIKLVWL